MSFTGVVDATLQSICRLCTYVMECIAVVHLLEMKSISLQHYLYKSRLRAVTERLTGMFLLGDLVSLMV